VSCVVVYGGRRMVWMMSGWVLYMVAGGGRVCQGRGKGERPATFSIQVRELEGKAAIEERAGNALSHNPNSSYAHSMHWKYIQQHTLVVPRNSRMERKDSFYRYPTGSADFLLRLLLITSATSKVKPPQKTTPTPHRKTVSQIDKPRSQAPISTIFRNLLRNIHHTAHLAHILTPEI
jgi:hypothetical protein